MSPDYAVRWWTRRGLNPPDLDPARYFAERVSWRYRHGVPSGAKARVELGDARRVLPRARRRFAMLLTSPPYYNVTNYRLDNWMRLWLLGEGASPDYATAQRYGDRERYAQMLRAVFAAAKRKLREDAVVYVRTDTRDFTRTTTQSILAEVWPSHERFVRAGKPKQSQTSLFGDRGDKPGETDFMLLPAGSPAPPGFLPAPPVRATGQSGRTTRANGRREAVADRTRLAP